MKRFIFCVISGALPLFALPPLPPLPPLPSLSTSGAKPKSSEKATKISSVSTVSLAASDSSGLSSSPSSSVITDSVATTSSEEFAGARLDPIMVDEGNLGAMPLGNDSEFDKNLEQMFASISEIEQQIAAFQGVELEIDGQYSSMQKRLGDFFIESDAFIGQTTAYLEDLESDLRKKEPVITGYNVSIVNDGIKKNVAGQLVQIQDAKKAIEELKKLLGAAKDGRVAMSSDEDGLRQKVVDLKKNSEELSGFYAQAVSAKNKLLSSPGEVVALLGQGKELSKKALDLVEQLKTKDAGMLKDLFKKIEGMVSSAGDAKKQVDAKLESLKKMITDLSRLASELEALEQAEQLKKSSSVVKAASNSATVGVDAENSLAKINTDAKPEEVVVQDDDEHNRVSMPYAVLATVRQGVDLLMNKTVAYVGDLFAWGHSIFSLAKNDDSSLNSDSQNKPDVVEPKNEQSELVSQEPALNLAPVLKPVALPS